MDYDCVPYNTVTKIVAAIICMASKESFLSSLFAFVTTEVEVGADDIINVKLCVLIHLTTTIFNKLMSVLL